MFSSTKDHSILLHIRFRQQSKRVYESGLPVSDSIEARVRLDNTANAAGKLLPQFRV
jgi:hypothetical protein